MTRTMNRTLDLVVMLGGPSAEREVSLTSGAAVSKALRARGHRVSELDPVKPDWTLPARVDAVFLALHGTYGEDGTVQERLETLGVPYTGCDAAASRIAFDKVLTKQRCLATGIPTARFEVLRDRAAGWPAGWRPPVVLKPVREGSSVGLQFVDRPDQWAGALAASLRHGGEVLLEERIQGRETTVAILEDRPLPVVEIRPRLGGYDYRNKYTAGATEYFCPAPFEDRVTHAIQEAGLAAFRAIGGRDYARVDVMVRADGSPVVLEVNTLPGMTPTSLFPKAAAAAGLDFATLCQRMIDLALRHPSAVPIS